MDTVDKNKKRKNKERRLPLTGFIGQGWIGRHYADDFEKKEYKVVRHGLEESHVSIG